MANGLAADAVQINREYFSKLLKLKHGNKDFSDSVRKAQEYFESGQPGSKLKAFEIVEGIIAPMREIVSRDPKKEALIRQQKSPKEPIAKIETMVRDAQTKAQAILDAFQPLNAAIRKHWEVKDYLKKHEKAAPKPDTRAGNSSDTEPLIGKTLTGVHVTGASPHDVKFAAEFLKCADGKQRAEILHRYYRQEELLKLESIKAGATYIETTGEGKVKLRRVIAVNQMEAKAQIENLLDQRPAGVVELTALKKAANEDRVKLLIPNI